MFFVHVNENYCIYVFCVVYVGFFLSQDHSACKASLTALAVKYASELKTHIPDVLEKLEELRKWKVAQETDCLSVCFLITIHTYIFDHSTAKYILTLTLLAPQAT